MPYLNNSLSSWATHRSHLRHLLYYTAAWLGTSLSMPLTGRKGKNLCLYSPMGAWPVVMWVNHVHSEFVKPMKGSQEPPFAYVGLITCWSSFSKSRKHWLAFTWSSTSWCLGHLALLGQCKKWILLLPSFPKKFFIAEEIGIKIFWRGLTLDSRIFFAVTMESVMTLMSWMLSFSMAGINPVWMAMSSASTDVTFKEWICRRRMMELSNQMWATAVAAFDFLTPPSMIMAMLHSDFWDALKVWLRFCRCWYRSSSDEEREEWKLILWEKWSTTLEPGEKRGWRGLKQFLTPLRYSLVSLMGLLRLICCLDMSLEVDVLWGGCPLACWEFSNEFMVWEGGMEA